jgi:hypothetical protein
MIYFRSLSVGSGVQLVTPPIVTQNLLVNYDFSNASCYPGTGTTVTNLIGNGNNSTFGASTIFTSTDGGILHFDGTNNSRLTMTVSSSFSSGITNKLTACTWVKPKINGTQGAAYEFRAIMGKADSGDSDDFSFGYNASNRLRVYIESTGENAVDSAASMSLNQWYYVCATIYTGSISFYINGVRDANSASFGTSYNMNLGKWGVGQMTEANWNTPLSGSVGAVHLYNEILSTAQILQNYNSTKVRYGL